jgi:hypothetical protein
MPDMQGGPMPGMAGGGGPQGTASITGGAPGAGPAPDRTGGVTTGGGAKGLQEAHKASVQTVIKVLEEGLPVWGSDSEQGTAIMKALQTLTKAFGTDPASDITKAHVQNLQDVLAGPQGPTTPGAGQQQPQGPQMNPALMQMMGGGGQ